MHLRIDSRRLFAGEHALIALAQQRGNRGEFFAGRAATHFGRVRGEDEPDLEPVEQLGIARRQRLDRSAQRRVARDGTLAPAPLAMQLLGQVHHLEVEPKRANHVDRIIEAQRIEDRIDLAVIPALRLRAVTARQRAQRFDVFKGARTRVRAQHVADEPPQSCNARP
jgi:hypothetical protein